MGKVKSIRFNDRTERMFNVLKFYYSKEEVISDSEIIIRGIEKQYDAISEKLNMLFRNEMEKECTNNGFALSTFEQICNMLEVLSISRGSLLQDEFASFLKVNVEKAELYELLDGLDGKGELVSKQYEKIYENVAKSCDKRGLDMALVDLNDYFYELFGERYKEEK